MLTPFTVSVGEFMDKRLCPKLVFGKAKLLPLGNSLVLVTVGTEENIMAREQSPFSDESLISHGMCWMHSCPSAWQLHWECTVFSPWWKSSCCISQSPSHCSEVSPREGRREVWCRCRFPCVDPSLRGSLPCPVFHQGLFVSAALSFPAFWHT